MTTQLNADDLLDLAQRHGFELVRSTRHRIVKRGALKFTLPSTGYGSAWLTNTLINVCTEIDARKDQRSRKPRVLPIMVAHGEDNYAVVAQDALRYKVQSLEDGRVNWLPKEECREVDIDEIDREAQRAVSNGALPPVAVEEPAPREEPFRVNSNDARLAEINPMAGWITETRRAIERLDVKIEQVEASLKPMRSQRHALQQALEAITGATGVVKMTLPSAKEPSRRGGTSRIAPEVKADIERRIRAGESSPDIARTTGVPYSTVAYYAAKAKG